MPVPEGLETGSIRFEVLQLQLFPKSGAPITEFEVGRWKTGTVTRSSEELSSRGDRTMVRQKSEYTFGLRNRDQWKVKCDASRPKGAGAVSKEAASASVYLCTHTSVSEGIPSFDFRLSPFDVDGDAGLVRIDDEYFTIEPVTGVMEGRPQALVAGYVIRQRGALVAAVESVVPRGFTLSESVSGWRADVLAATATAIAVAGESHYDAVRPWVDPGGSF